MENLEEQIINRIKQFLINHNMNLITSLDNDNSLFESTDLILCSTNESDEYVCFWVSINDMLFSKDNIFHILFKYFNFPNSIYQCSGESLEEIAIKMDLMGM